MQIYIFESTAYESWYLDDELWVKGAMRYETGVGVRANVGEKDGLCSSADLSLPSLMKLAKL